MKSMSDGLNPFKDEETAMKSNNENPVAQRKLAAVVILLTLPLLNPENKI